MDILHFALVLFKKNFFATLKYQKTIDLQRIRSREWEQSTIDSSFI